MARVKQVQTTFHKGELSPNIIGRSDVDARSQGSIRFRNLRILAQGACERRPGTEYLVDLAAASRLIPFQFGDGEDYLFALSNGKLEIFDPDSDTIIQTITTSIPWVTAELYDITFSQAGDYIILCHESWIPQLITRTSATTFSRADFAFLTKGGTLRQPYFKFAASDATMTLSNHAVGTGRTLTCSASYFTSAMATNQVRFQIGTGQVKVTGYTNANQVTVEVEKTVTIPLPADPIFALSGTDDVEVTWPDHPLVATDTFNLAGGIAFGGLDDAWATGVLTVDSVKDADTIVCDTTAAGTFANGARGGGIEVVVTDSGYATVLWSEQAFSAVRGWPSAVVFHQERLYFGGTTQIPDGLWGSVIGDFFNFDAGDGLDDEAVSVLVGTGEINRIRHLLSGRNLEIFTTGGELYIRQQLGDPITPSNIQVSKQTAYGSSAPQPHIFDGATIFVQKSGTSVRDYVYSDAELAYSAPSISILSSQVLVTPLQSEVIYGNQAYPESYALIANTDGSLAVYTSLKSENLSGWAVWECDGDRTFTSIAVIQDTIYAIILQGSTYRLCRFVDGATLDLYDETTYGSDQTVTSYAAGSRFASEADVPAVLVDTDGTTLSYLGPITFDGSGNSTSFPSTAVTTGQSIRVGYDYSVELTPMPLNALLPDGQRAGYPQRLVRVILESDSKLSAVRSGNTLTIQRNTNPLTALSVYAKRRNEFYMLGYSRDPVVNFIQNEPLPLKLYTFSYEVAA